MKNSFSELLSEFISQSGTSKNEIIRACDIDRSSFFKFLNGGRIPTNEQLNKICSKLQFTAPEEKALRLEYARVTIGERKVLTHQRIAQLLWKMEETENSKTVERKSDYCAGTEIKETTVNGKARVIELLVNTIIQELAEGTGRCEIDAFLPSEADEILNWIVSFISGEQGDGIKFRHLIELPARNNQADQVVIDRLKFALLCTLVNPSSYSGYYYYSGDSISSSLGVLYAYSLVAEHRVVLMNERMDKAILITDQECCRDYKSHFVSALNCAHPIMKKVDCQRASEELSCPVLYLYGSRVGSDRTDVNNSVKYISLAGIKRIAGLGSFSDESTSKTISSNERVRKLNEIRNEIGTHVFIIDERNIPPAQTWCVALSGKDKLIFYKADSEYFFIITEPEVVQAFYRFMSELPDSGYLLRNDLALDIIDGLIAGVSNQ